MYGMIRLEHICYVVDEKVILDDINLELGSEFIAITGPNGSGKSTLAKIIMGLITPTSGKIYFEGEDITNLTIDERANRGIGYAFQQATDWHKASPSACAAAAEKEVR